MNKNVFLLYIILFSLGWTMSSAYFYFASENSFYPYRSPSAAFSSHADTKQMVTEKVQDSGIEILEGIIGDPLVPSDDKDVPSPSSRIKIEDISVYDDEIVLRVKNPKWAIFTDTKSMDPVIDSSTKAIELIPSSPEDIRVGDIVAYSSKYVDGTVAHRVIETGYDSFGWYARLKGDNNPNPDPEKVRMQQIKGVVAAIIY
jgi:hypothetical protein